MSTNKSVVSASQNEKLDHKIKIKDDTSNTAGQQHISHGKPTCARKIP